MDINILELITLNKKMNNIQDSDNVLVNNLAINQMRENTNFCQLISNEIIKIETDTNCTSKYLIKSTNPHKNNFQISSGDYISLSDKGLNELKKVINVNDIKKSTQLHDLKLAEVLSLGACLKAVKNPQLENSYTEFSEEYINVAIKDRYQAKTLSILSQIEKSVNGHHYEDAYKASLALQTAVNSKFFNVKEILMATEIMNFSFAQKQTNGDSVQLEKSANTFINKTISKLKESDFFEKNENKNSLSLKVKLG